MTHTCARHLGIAAFLALLVGCATPQPPPTDLLAPSAEQLKIRSMQSRSFDTTDRQKAVRAVMEALQDLGFIIERVNEPMGLVSAARFAEPRYYDLVGLTVTVRPEGSKSLMIRVNAIYNNKPIEDPEVYQNFFATLERSLFIGRN